MTDAGQLTPLLATKAALGAVEVLDYRALDLVSAHRRLGETVRGQVRHILRRQFRTFSPDELMARVRLARQCQAALAAKRAQPGEAACQAALDAYAACLAAWAEGAALAALAPAGDLPPVRVDGQDVTGDDLAFLLQDDAVGCQTGLWRAADGSVYLSHTEEDREPLGDRFDRLRLMIYSLGADAGGAPWAYALVYPDLLPGPAFAWRSDNYIQAVDSLYIGSKDARPGLLANMVAWVTLYLGQQVDVETVLRHVGPFVDGYALNTVWARGASVQGQTVEYVGDYWRSRRLGEAPGSALYQVNMFSPASASAAQIYETLEPEKRRHMQARLDRAERWFAGLGAAADVRAALAQFLSSTEGADYACANQDVKAYLIAHSAAGQLEVEVMPGPALAGDQPARYAHAE